MFIHFSFALQIFANITLSVAIPIQVYLVVCIMLLPFGQRMLSTGGNKSYGMKILEDTSALKVSLVF